MDCALLVLHFWTVDVKVGGEAEYLILDSGYSIADINIMFIKLFQ